MTERNRFPTLNPSGFNDAQKSVLVVNNAMKGRLNNQLEVTLKANAALTTVVSPLLGVASALQFMPLTDNADAAMRSGPLYPSVQSSGSTVIKHANDANVDKTFVVTVFG